MYWAHNSRQAIILAKKFTGRGFTVTATALNYHAMNMYPKPLTITDYIAQGGKV